MFYKGQPAWNKGKKWSKESKLKMSLASKGIHRSPTTEFKKGQNAGPNNSNWRGGISKQNRTSRKQIMDTVEYQKWRTAVFERDDYRCYDCGAKSGEVGNQLNLHADHIYPFRFFPRLIFVLENGRTLCESCHRKTNTWGRPSKALLQQFAMNTNKPQ